VLLITVHFKNIVTVVHNVFMQTDNASTNVAHHLIADIFCSYFDAQTGAVQEMCKIRKGVNSRTLQNPDIKFPELSRSLKKENNSITFKNFPGGMKNNCP